MPSSFNSREYVSVGVDLTTTSLTDAVTSAADSRCIVKSIILANHTGTAANIDVKWYDASGTATFWILPTYSLGANTSYEVLGKNSGPIVLSESDKIQLQAGTANAINATITYMALSRSTGN